MGRDPEGRPEVRILTEQQYRSIELQVHALRVDIKAINAEKADMAIDLKVLRQQNDRYRNQVETGAATLETVADMIRVVHLENKRLKAENERLRVAAGDQ